MMRKKYLVTAGGALAVAVALSGCGAQAEGGGSNQALNADAKNVTLTITSNAVSGGKNTVEADWITNYVIPEFTAAQKAKGVTAKVTFNPNGVEDEQYKTKVSLDLSTGGGADIVSLDGIWFGEFADAGYIKPLDDVVGEDLVSDWDGWDQIKPAVQQLTSYKDELYGIPDGTDGRFLYFNKNLFKKAGLPTDWQPESWDDILSAAAKLKSLDGVTPLQINAGTAMGEATSMQGFAPFLVGTGEPIWKDGTWQGASDGMEKVLSLYSDVYVSEKLGDPLIQQEAKGRDKSFEMFANNQLGIMIESDYLWRSVINPTVGTAPMADRDSAVGYALIPAEKPGAGVNGQDYVSMSGGSGRVLNPGTKYPQQAFELLTFMASAEALKEKLGATPQISARDDVNEELLSSDPLLSFVAEKVLPVTSYRPSLSEYTQVSSAMQEATAAVVGGQSAAEAAKAYEETLEGIVGGSDNIFH
ncbi:MAG TPA: extracellular solute-binding protein [Glaciibacter sp.]|nr:extracellular solute-binding protein [Glaciibacter sp.]